MTEFQVFTEIATGKVAAVYRDCKTNSTVFKDKSLYTEDNQINPGVIPQIDGSLIPAVAPIKSFTEAVEDVLRARGLII